MIKIILIIFVATAVLTCCVFAEDGARVIDMDNWKNNIVKIDYGVDNEPQVSITPKETPEVKTVSTKAVIPVPVEEKPKKVRYGGGNVAEIDRTNGKITCTEYDWYDRQDKDITYTVSPDVKIKNAFTYQDIRIGDYLDIKYVMGDHGERVAISIVVYPPGSAGF